jgi:hypothetical protein
MTPRTLPPHERVSEATGAGVALMSVAEFKRRACEIPQCHQGNRRYIAIEKGKSAVDARYLVAGGPEHSHFQPFLLDLPGSRRYIPHTFRQAVSFACSERPPDQPFESVAFSRKVIGYNASTNKAQTLPLTAPVRLLRVNGRGA